MNTAFITWGTLIACVAVFLVKLNLERQYGSMDAAMRLGAMYAPSVRRGQWYRLITAGFVHFNFWHLAMNMYVLINLGPYLEAVFGHARYAMLLFGSVVFGNLMTIWLGEDHSVSAGLSGGLYGLMLSSMVLRLSMGGWSSILSGSMLYTILVNLILNFMPGVGWKAHLGGGAFGILFTRLMLRL